MGKRCVIVLAAVWACACARPSERAPMDRDVEQPATKEAEPKPAIAPVEVAAPPPIVGRWRMIAEEPADGQGPIFGQERRLLELGADASFRIQNWVETREGPWRLEGTQLVLERDRVEVERVDDRTLVLVEDLPEIYLRGGAPRKVRNTYRRISESELGPMLGERVETSRPGPGRYLAAYTYATNKLPTMEITIDKHVNGRARLELFDDHRAEGCFGVATSERSSRSKFASRDGKHHSDEDQSRMLVAMHGTWTADADAIRVTASSTWIGSCTPSPERSRTGPLELQCVAIARNDRLPIPLVACRIVQGQSMLQELALNPADTERAGPYTMQVEPMGRIQPEPGRPWLVLGAAPGLHVKSEDGRRDHTPTVTFTAGNVELVESDFRD